MVERPQDKPIIELKSRFSIEDLPRDCMCELCEKGPMTAILVPDWSPLFDKVTLKVCDVPALHCVGDCGGAQFLPEIVFDLWEQALPIMKAYGEDEEMIQECLRDLVDTSKSIRSEPEILRAQILLNLRDKFGNILPWPSELPKKS